MFDSVLQISDHFTPDSILRPRNTPRSVGLSRSYIVRVVVILSSIQRLKTRQTDNNKVSRETIPRDWPIMLPSKIVFEKKINLTKLLQIRLVT